jgi:hypothetical protein
VKKLPALASVDEAGDGRKKSGSIDKSGAGAGGMDSPATSQPRRISTGSSGSAASSASAPGDKKDSFIATPRGADTPSHKKIDVRKLAEQDSDTSDGEDEGKGTKDEDYEDGG